MIRRTYGSVKEQLARVTQNGICPTDPLLMARVNEAQERLLNKGLYAGTYGRYSVCVYGGCITLPREFESILGYNFGGFPAQVYNQWYEFMANGPGMVQAGDWRQLIDRGYVPCFRSLPGQSFIRVYTDLNEESISTILFRGSDINNNRVQTLENSEYIESNSYIDGEKLNLLTGSPSGNSVCYVTHTTSLFNGVYVPYGTINGRIRFKRFAPVSPSPFPEVNPESVNLYLQWDPVQLTAWIITGEDSSTPDYFEPLTFPSEDVLYPWLGTPADAGCSCTQLTKTTINSFAQIDAINKTPTKGWVRIYAVNPETAVESCIAILAPDETLPQYRRYAIPGFENEEGSAVTVLAKRKFIPVTRDDDDLIVTNLGALKMMAIAIEKEENNNLVEAKIYEDKAVELLKEELKEVDGANIGRPQVQMRMFAMGEIPNMA
jgi:hypothetical protein